MVRFNVGLRDYDSAIYNDLPDVLNAQRNLKAKRSHKLSFRKIAEDVTSHGCDDLFGLTLLHRHNNVPTGQRMEEDLSPGESALSMQLEAPTCTAVPVLWKVGKASNRFFLTPLEFSRRPFAATLYERALANGLALERLCERIWASGLAEIVGISLLRFDEIRSENLLLVEQEAEDRVANVVRPMSRADIDETNIIETNWRFSVADGPGTVPTAGCNPDVICVKGYDGRHRREPRHWTFGP